MLAMARSTTGTPIPNIKTQYTDKHVWVHEYYNPGAEEDCSLDANLQLKGWHKVKVSKDNDPQTALSDKDIIDLNGYKYYKDEPVVHKPDENEMDLDKQELGNALSTKTEDGQISSLSGIA